MIGQLADHTSLTKEQRVGQRRARYDLAAGYPTFDLPEPLLSCVGGGANRAIRTSWRDAAAEGQARAEELNLAVRSLLGIGLDSTSEVFTTFSGSVSIERVFAAALNAAKAAGSDGVDLILLEPCVDIFRLMVTCSDDFRVIPVVSFDAEASIDLLVEAIQRSASNRARKVVVCLESPRNPLGSVFTEPQIEELAAVCGDADALLVIDHCFLLAGVQDAGSVPAICGGLSRPCQWIALWDTGKTIDLNGAKLGFVIASDREVAGWIESSIAAIQVATALQPLSVFAALLSHCALPRYFDHARTTCRANIDRLLSVLPSPWSATHPDAGCFCCLTWYGSEIDPTTLRNAFLAGGVNTASSQPFFSGSPPPDRSFVRIALAREQDHFAAAADQIAAVLRVLPAPR